MKKISNWLFRKDLELNKRWWHRFIKVSYFLVAGLVTTGFIIAVLAEPYSEYFLNHNVNKVTLGDYSRNYNGSETDNTLYKFLEEGDNFGVVINNKLVDKYLYLSDYTFDRGSFCLKDPIKYIDWIKKITIEKVNQEVEITTRGYKLTTEETNSLNNQLQKAFEDDPERKCILYTTDSDLKNLDNGQESIVILEPNILYFLELIVGVLLISLLTWLVFALLYYRLIMYIIFGSKK